MKLPTTTWLILVCLTVSSLFFSIMGLAHAEVPFAGKYELVSPPQPTVNPDKVKVVELFWYTCPHCAYFEKHYLSAWREKKPDYVEFVHMPAVFNINSKRIPLAKAYYTAEILDVLDKVHVPIFEALHDHKRRMDNEKALQQLFAKHGVSKVDFTKAYHSFFVNMRIRHAREMTARYGIRSVPVVIVNGKYRLTSKMADGYVNMMKILDYLIEKEHKLMVGNLSSN